MYVLESSTTESNITEIKKTISDFPESEANIIITSGYHLKRTKVLACKFYLETKILGAEDILEKYGDEYLKLEVHKYINSFGYKIKIMRENILCVFIESLFLQKIIKTVRHRSYN